MIVSINQPAYLPWPGYFDRIAASDVHVVLDHVQFEKNSFVNRNKVRTPQSWTWLTVPVRTKGRFGALAIRDLETDTGSGWAQKHLATIKSNYARAPYFATLFPELAAIYANQAATNRFLEPTMAISRWILERLGIGTPLVSSSALDLTQRSSDLVLEICVRLGAKRYLSGPLGRNYLELEKFRASGIEVVFHAYASRPYRQCWPGFEAGLSSIDMLMNMSTDETLLLMRAGHSVET